MKITIYALTVRATRPVDIDTHSCPRVEVSARMKANRLQLNQDKTEVLWCASSRRQHQIPTDPACVGDALVSQVTAARYLGVFFIDADVTMKTQVTNTVKACFAALRQIRSVRRSLAQHALLTLI